MVRGALTSLVAVGIIVGAPSGAGAARRFALVVAQNAPADGDLKPLRYADDDGLRYAEMFAAYGAEVVLLAILDADTQRRFPGAASRTKAPTRAEIQSAMAALNARMDAVRQAGGEADFYFVYAGHGEAGPSGEGRMHLHGEVLTRRELLTDVVAASHASFNHLLIDACHAEALVFPRGGNDDGWRDESYHETIEQYLGRQDLREWPNTGAVLAASSDRETHEWEVVGGGVFSHEARSGLVGMADANGDQAIEYSELAAWLAAAGQGLPDPRTRSRFQVHAPPLDRNRPLAIVTEGQLGFLGLPVGFQGHAWLEDARGVRYADLHPSGEVAVLLALAPSSYYFLRRAGEEARLESGSRVDGRTLSWRPAAAATRGAVDDSFRRHLFSVGFGPGYYQGYVASSGDVPALRRAVSDPFVAQAAAPASAGTSAWPWVTGGLALGAGAAAVALGLGAQSDYDAWRARVDGEGVDDAGLRDGVDRKRTWGYVLGGVAVASGLASVWLLVQGHDEATALTWAPTADGAAFSGRF